MNGKNCKHTYNRKNKKRKFVLEFDENARREYLTGFRKRNLQRKAKAAEKLQEKLKVERKRIKAETKQFYKKLIQTQKPIPEVSNLITENIDMGNHCVSVTEISPLAAAQECRWIGQNQVCYENNENMDNEDENKSDAEEEVIEGMEMFSKQKNLKEVNNLNIKTSKDFKKIIKKQATHNVQQSKVFKTKSKVAQIKNIKRKKREERKRRRDAIRKQKMQNEH